MGFPWSRSQPQRPIGPGLESPIHPARRWIDAATIVANRRLSFVPGDPEPTLQADWAALEDLSETLSLALADAPGDPDLLVARASARYLRGEVPAARQDLEVALSNAPANAEGLALKRYGERWNNLFFLPPWSTSSREVHLVMAHRANRDDTLMCVRHHLQAALAILIRVEPGSQGEAASRFRWEVVARDTPFGPIGAHYVLLDVGGTIRRREFFLAPATNRREGTESPAPLVDRMAGVRTCFFVLAEQSGKVVQCLEYELPAGVQQILGQLSRKLSAVAGADAAGVRRAAEWHMAHFNMDTLGFPD